MAPQPRWYEHVPPSVGKVPCEGEVHHLAWRRGKVKLEDHDLGGERALLVLGGQPSPCLHALRFWESQFGLPPELFDQMQRWLGSNAALAPKELERPRALGMLLSWERAWKADGYFGKHGGLIERQLRALALPTLRTHLNLVKDAFGCRVVRSAAMKLAPAGRPVSLTGGMDRVSVNAEATLSTDWALDVWARDAALVGESFVLALLGPAPAAAGPAATAGPAAAGYVVTAARWRAGPGGAAVPSTGKAVLRRGPGGGWELDWEPFESPATRVEGSP